MTDKERKKFTVLRAVALTAAALTLVVVFRSFFLSCFYDAALYSAKSLLPTLSQVYPAEETTLQEKQETSALRQSTESSSQTTAPVEEKFTDTPEDVLSVMAKKQKTAHKDKKDGAIFEKQYKSEGVTDSFGNVRVKNVNKTAVDIEKELKKDIDLQLKKGEAAVLIFHTHTTETFQLLDRGFYETGFNTRSNDKGVNMVRVGEEICSEIRKAGFEVIHDKVIHDSTYSGAYSHSRKTVEEYLEENPSIEIVLDIHRDAIEQSDGTKIKPTAVIDGKKAAQIMIITGCQEKGGPIENFPDWRYNLTFALQLQNKLEESFPGITRPLYFCPRKYNMDLTHCSVLVEVGSDVNTLEEAVYTGKCLGVAVSEILKEYKDK